MNSNLFIIINLILGIFLLSLTINIIKLTRRCRNTTFNTTMKIILILSVIIITSSISTLICRAKCDCTQVNEISNSVIGGFFVVLGSILLVCSIILQILSKIRNECNVNDYSIVILLMLGIFMVISSFSYLYTTNKETLKQKMLELM